MPRSPDPSPTMPLPPDAVRSRAASARALAAPILAILAGSVFAVWITFGTPTTSADCFAEKICDGLTFRVVGELLVSGKVPYRADLRIAHVASTRLRGRPPPFDLPFQYPPHALPLFAIRAIGPADLNALLGSAFTTLAALAFLFFCLRRQPLRLLWILMAAFWPVLWLNAYLAQTGALAAALAFGALALGSRFPVGSGVFLGLLSFKPHYALPLLLAAIVYRKWRTVVTAISVGLFLSVVSTAIWGLEIWPEALKTLLLANDTALYMASWLGPASRVAPADAARLAWPTFVMGIVLVIVGMVRGKRLGWQWETVGAGALASLLYFSPNTHPYDLMLLLPGMVLLLGRLPWWAQVVCAIVVWTIGWAGVEDLSLRYWHTVLLLFVAIAWAIAVARRSEPVSSVMTMGGGKTDPG